MPLGLWPQSVVQPLVPPPQLHQLMASLSQPQPQPQSKPAHPQWVQVRVHVRVQVLVQVQVSARPITPAMAMAVVQPQRPPVLWWPTADPCGWCPPSPVRFRCRGAMPKKAARRGRRHL